MSESRPLSDNDLELLSAYADGALSDSERQQLEARLHAEPALQAELDALRETIRLIKSLPSLRAPRAYTLTREMVGLPAVQPRRAIPFVLTTAFSAVSAAAAVFLIVFGVLLNNQSSMPAATSNVAMMATPSQSAAARSEVTDELESETGLFADAVQQATVELQFSPSAANEIEPGMDDGAAAAAPPLETMYFAPDSMLTTPEIMPTFNEETARTMEQAFMEDAAAGGMGGGAGDTADSATGGAMPEDVLPPMMAAPFGSTASTFMPTPSKTLLAPLNTPTMLPTQVVIAVPTLAPQPNPAPESVGELEQTQMVESETVNTVGITGTALVIGGLILLTVSVLSILFRRSRQARSK